MELLIKERTVLGKKVKSLRREGYVPAEVYGHGKENMHVQVLEKELRKVLKTAGSHALLSAVTDKGEKIPVLLNSIDKNPISGEILSVDLHAVRMDEKVQTKIPVHMIGVAPAIKNGFVVVQAATEVEIEALPNKLISSVEVDVSNLQDPGQGIHVSDIKVPEGVRILADADSVVVTVTEKAKEEEVVTPETTAEGAPTTPETTAETAPATEKTT